MDDFSLYFHRSVLSRLQRNPRGVRCVVPSLLIVQNICRARTGLVNPRIPLRPKRNNGILHFIRGSRVPWYPSFSQLPFVSNSNVARESNVRRHAATLQLASYQRKSERYAFHRGFRVPRESGEDSINHNFHFSSRPPRIIKNLTRFLRRIKFNLSAMLLFSRFLPLPFYFWIISSSRNVSFREVSYCDIALRV